MPTLAQATALGYRGLPAVYAGNSNIFERGPSAAPSGGYTVKEAFTEMQFPLLSEKPFARSLDLNTAVRLAGLRRQRQHVGVESGCGLVAQQRSAFPAHAARVTCGRAPCPSASIPRAVPATWYPEPGVGAVRRERGRRR